MVIHGGTVTLGNRTDQSKPILAQKSLTKMVSVATKSFFHL